MTSTDLRRFAARPTRLAWLLFVLLILPAAAARAESFFDRVLRVLGVTAVPGEMKGHAPPGEGVGRLYLATVADGSSRPLTSDGGYSWPIFSLDGKAVLALHGDEVVVINIANGTQIHKSLPGLAKLVGVDREQPTDILVLKRDASAPVALLSQTSWTTRPLPYDAKDPAQHRLMVSLKAEERSYGDKRLLVETQSKSTPEGTLEWQEVFLQSATVRKQLSACAGLSCRQPALSSDGRLAVYIREGEARAGH